jgi:Fe-S cluster assembly iron-binding protein IscA
MLAMTTDAEEAIRGILESENVPDGAVFRISAQEAAGPEPQSQFAVSITDSPPAEDQVVEGEDVEIRVEPIAAEMLDDKQLDASVEGEQVNFSLSDQGKA